MLDTDIRFLKGVGPGRAARLNKLNIFTVEDLLNHFPVRYEDRRTVKKINRLSDGEKCLLMIKIYGKSEKARIRKNMTVLKTAGMDDTGFITLTFFNQNFLSDKLTEGEMYYVFGEVKAAYGKLEMVNPEIELCEKDWKTGKILPIYSLTAGLSNNELTKLIKTAFEAYYEKIQDVIPAGIREEYKLASRKSALMNLHFPENGRKYSLGKKTMVYEKLLIMQLGLRALKNNLNRNARGNEIKCTTLADRLIDAIPYRLTDAQLKVIDEIKRDMSMGRAMNRLVQGDVGSGKTVVAVYSLLAAVESGYQAAMMAPTEILALQHFDTIREYLSVADINIKVVFLSGSTKSNEKKEILKDLKDGKTDIIVGTHSLIEENVEFKNIGLAITDEQHRFGVRQRGRLSGKGNSPDILVMTATPIPRTLALMLYGDLDISVIDEMPPGRQKVITDILKGNERERAYEFIKKQADEGRQAYIVTPLVEESEKMELNSASEIFDELRSNYFSDYSLGLLHGKFQSYCILINESRTKKAADRMSILKNTDNGFIIAEEDLKIRGPGEFFGTRQHGLSGYDIQNIVNDVEYVQDVQYISNKISEENPGLAGDDYINLKKAIINLFKDETIAFN